MWSFAIAISAQEWQTTFVKADELKGTPNYEAMIFTDVEKKGLITLWNIKQDDFRICSLNHVFRSNHLKGASFKPLVVGTIGLYDETDKIIEKLDNFPFEVDGIDQMNSLHPNRYTLKGGNNKKKNQNNN